VAPARTREPRGRQCRCPPPHDASRSRAKNRHRPAVVPPFGRWRHGHGYSLHPRAAVCSWGAARLDLPNPAELRGRWRILCGMEEDLQGHPVHLASSLTCRPPRQSVQCIALTVGTVSVNGGRTVDPHGVDEGDRGYGARPERRRRCQWPTSGLLFPPVRAQPPRRLPSALRSPSWCENLSAVYPTGAFPWPLGQGTIQHAHRGPHSSFFPS